MGKEQITISCQIAATKPGLHLQARVDDMIFFEGDPMDAGRCQLVMADDDGEHRLMFILSGKMPEQTVIDADGNILDDITAMISDIYFDEIALGHLVVTHAKYHHDFNGTQVPVTEEFYGTMGCNGTVTLEFTTPIYLWLLENM